MKFTIIPSRTFAGVVILHLKTIRYVVICEISYSREGTYERRMER